MPFTISEYPLPPKEPNRQYIQPTSEFKRQVIKVFLLCVLFLLTYIVVVAIALGLAALIVLLAGAVALAVPNIVTFLLILGGFGLAVMIVIFVFNSLVIKLNRGREGAVQIFEKDEPLLFEFTRRVTTEAGSSFPKKIFLVEDVNALVAYDSVLLSMFFPQRKNLYIGAGLINSLTISEFKGVLGHEFGHFSQKSMTLGAYVYHFNLIIHKILFDNERYNTAFTNWGNSSWYFRIFKELASLIIQAIQWVMRKVYVLLNKEHMSLSRQMEFHADAVAASVSGSRSNITAQYRSDFAMECYTELLNFYGTLIRENRKAENVYTHHFKLMQLYAAKYKIHLNNGLPMIDANSFDLFGKSRIMIKDQWASHPNTSDRVAFFSEMNIDAGLVDNSAWELFSDAARIQQEFTDKLYEDVQFEQAPLLLSVEEFEVKYIDHMASTSLQPKFNGYYDNRNIERFELETSDNEVCSSLSTDLFSDDFTRLPALIVNLENDINVLESLSEGNTGIRSFDFDGEKFPAYEAEIIKGRLKKELEEARLKISDHDKSIYHYTLGLCTSVTEKAQLKQAYAAMFLQFELAELDLKLYNEMIDVVNPVYTTMQHADIKIQVLQIIRKEKELKGRFQELLSNEKLIAEDSLAEYLKCIEKLINSDHIYYTSEQYLNDEIQLLNDALNAFLSITIEYNFLVKKHALGLQNNVLNKQGALEQAEPQIL
jgi:Zn-dependent protease with chaperone function